MRRGERMLRRLPVMRGNDDGLGGVGERAGRRVVGIQIGKDPPAAVDVQDDRERAFPFWRVDADRNVAAGTNDGLVLHTGDRLRCGALALPLQQCFHGIGGRGLLARFFRRERFRRFGSEFGKLVEHGLHLLVRLRRIVCGADDGCGGHQRGGNQDVFHA